jgi:hypothetical protein
MKRREWAMNILSALSGTALGAVVMRDRNTHFVDGQPRIIEGTGPLSSAASSDFRSLLAGRVVGVYKDVGAPPDQKELVNILGPAHCAMGMTLTLAGPLQNKPVVSLGVDQYASFDAAVAMVSWGAGGMQTYAEVDFGRGGSIPLFASSVQVLVRRENIAGTPVISSWGAFITHLPSGKTMAPTRTIRSFAPLLAATGFFIVCPPFAKEVFFDGFAVGAFPNTIGPLNIILQDVTGAGIGSITIPAGGGNPEPIRLPNDCAQILLFNASATAIFNWRAVFNLAL